MSVKRYYCYGIEDPCEDYNMPQGKYVLASDYDKLVENQELVIKAKIADEDELTQLRRVRGAAARFRCMVVGNLSSGEQEAALHPLITRLCAALDACNEESSPLDVAGVVRQLRGLAKLMVDDTGETMYTREIVLLAKSLEGKDA